MFKHIETKGDFIRNFSPAWFASVMGTGILAKTSLDYSKYFPPLEFVSYILFYFNIGLFFFLLIPWILRWGTCKKECKNDFNDPVLSNFYPTIAIGSLVLSINFMTIGNDIFVASIFWVIGVIGTFIFGIAIPYKMFLGENFKVHHISPAMFIPPVGFILIPVPGSIFVSLSTGIFQEMVIFINYSSWGTGFFLYLALLAVWMYRFFLHKELPRELMPTLWVNLGPIGVGIIALFNLIKFSPFVASSQETFQIAGFLFWGFGIWWIIMAFMLLIHYIANKNFSFALSWWAFVFPLGAYVASTNVIATTFSNSFIDYIGFVLYWCLVVFWFATFILSIVHTFSGKIFAPKKVASSSSKLKSQ